MPTSVPPGFLIVDKPPGVTSFSIVAMVRRLTAVRRVGHAGTLDPMATGVLPVAVGRATRLIEYMDDAPKTYLASIRLGVSTDTYDAEGEVTFKGEADGVTPDALDAALRSFVGEIEQRPPAYSALKLAGRPLYKYAREGTSVDIAPRIVHIDEINLIAFEDGNVRVEVTCRKGTYIRSLAHDLGERLGCGAHLSSLRRTSSGGFSIEQGHKPERIAAAAGGGQLEDLLLASDRAVERRAAVILDDPHAADVAAGRDLSLAERTVAAICRAYSTEGEFLGMLRKTGEALWHPEKVFVRA